MNPIRVWKLYETLWEVLILSHFSSSENPKEKWLTFKIFLKFSSAENYVMPPVHGVLIHLLLLSYLNWLGKSHIDCVIKAHSLTIHDICPPLARLVTWHCVETYIRNIIFNEDTWHMFTPQMWLPILSLISAGNFHCEIGFLTCFYIMTCVLS